MSDPRTVRSSFRPAKLPARYAPVVLPLLLSILMTCVVSLISTLVGGGFALDMWLRSWALSWVIAFPTLLVVLPLVRRVAAALVETDAQPVRVSEPSSAGPVASAPAPAAQGRDSHR